MEMIGYVVEAGVVVVAYSVVANRMLKVGAALRDRVLVQANQLLANGSFPQALKGDIQAMTPRLAEPRVAWLFAFGTIPAIWAKPDQADMAAEAEIPAELVAGWREFQKLSILAVMMTSPAACVLLLAQLAIITFFVSFSLIADVLLMKVKTLTPRGPFLPTGLRGA